MKCEAPSEDDFFIEMILYALVSINSTGSSGVQDPSGLQATLLATLRDVLLESGTQPPPGLDRLVTRSQRLHQRRQRRRQREAVRQQLQQAEGDTDIPDHAAGSPTVGTDSSDHPRVSSSEDTNIPDHGAVFQEVNMNPSYGASQLPLQQSGDAAQHLSRLMAVTQGLNISQLTTHQVTSATPGAEERGHPRLQQRLPEEQRRRPRCPSEARCNPWVESGNEE